MGIDPERYLKGVAGKHRMVRTDRWKLLYIPDPVGGKRLLFDILADPGEQKNLAAEHPEIVEKLFAELEKVDGSGLGGHGVGALCSPRRCRHPKSKLMVSRTDAPTDTESDAPTDT